MDVVQTDSAGHEFIDTATLIEEHVRTTLIPAEVAGYGEVSIRIQIRAANGKLRPGPEVLLSVVPGMIAAMNKLMRKD
ncbi:MAG: hypothetical protein ABII12_10860 [Planctomycetota bacterium]